MIPQVGASPEAPFPPVEQALESPDGLLAWGGDLAPARLERAYRSGIFPWYSEDQPILWWSPATRCVFDTDRPHVSRRLLRVLRQGRFRLTADTDFEGVIHGCAWSRGSTWITPEMLDAYRHMHELGYAHSIEAWADDRLVGGLYGLSFGHLFFGESMFSAENEASKVVLVSLCRVLSAWGYPILDAQVPNEHLLRMGAREISRADFLCRQAPLLRRETRSGSWRSAFAATLAQVSDN